MAAIGHYNISEQYRGDTFDGVRFTLINKSDNTPINLTNTAIRVQFRFEKEKGKVLKNLTIGDGITVEDAVNGIFKIDSFIIDFDAGHYKYDVQVTFENGVIKSYIRGYMNVIQDVTNG